MSDATTGNGDGTVESLFDSNADGLPDFQDGTNDTDGDGVSNLFELAEGTDGADSNSFLDTDGDGISDFADPDSDGDGDLDINETGGDPYVDADLDGVPVYLDDNDAVASIGDENDRSEDAFDGDGNGIADFQDDGNDTDGDGVPNAVETAEMTSPDDDTNFVDSDQDGIADFVESDSDNDGVP